MNFFNNLSTLKNFSEVSERLRKALDKLTNYAWLKIKLLFDN